MEFNIYQREMDGNDFLIDTISAETKENAINTYYQKNDISEDKMWLFYVVSKRKDDEEKAILKEAGCSNWDEYYDEMCPSRPIEL